MAELITANHIDHVTSGMRQIGKLLMIDIGGFDSDCHWFGNGFEPFLDRRFGIGDCLELI